MLKKTSLSDLSLKILITKIYNLFKKINKFLCIFICNNLSPQNRINIYLFNFFKFLAQDRIYFIEYSQKKKFIEFIKISLKDKNSLFQSEIDKIKMDENLIYALNDLNEIGLSQRLNINIEDKDIENLVTYFDKSDYYDSHIPHLSLKKNNLIKPNSAYKSYDYETQLNNSTLLKLCLNKNIIKLAEQYLGCVPKIYSINTFKTLTQKKAFTHEFHRDIDNLKWLVVFIYWTKTSKDDGAYEQIKFTHKPSQKLNDILKNYSDHFSNNFDGFFLKTVPGYGLSHLYNKCFDNEIENVSGDPGKVVVTDTIGLHRGTNVKKDRLVTWIRFGVLPSRQQLLNYKGTSKNKIQLSDENVSILKKSKFSEVLSNIL